MTGIYDFMTNTLRFLTTKGDIPLKATTGYSKLAVGSDGFLLGANSNAMNGLAYQDNPVRVTTQSGVYFCSSIGTAAASISTGKAFCVPIYVKVRAAVTSISFSVNTATAVSYKTALYVDSAGIPGAQVAGTAVTSAAQTTAATNINVDNSFTAVTLDAGWYWAVFTADGASTMNNESSTSADYLLGAIDSIPGVGSVRYITHTYANPLPDPLGVTTFAVQSSGVRPVRLYLKKQ